MAYGFLKVCAIKAPGFGENRKACLQDLAALTGGEVGSIGYFVVHYDFAEGVMGEIISFLAFLFTLNFRS